MNRVLCGMVAAGIASGLWAQSPAASKAIERARTLAQTNQLTEANAVLSDALAREPEDGDLTAELGQVQLAQGLNEDAMKSFESALTNKPGLDAARDGEVRAAEAAALADRKVGIDGSALLCLIRARKFVPDSPRLLFDFGMQAESMRIYGDADTALREARRLAPGDAKILYALAHVELDEQKMPEAEQDLRSYLKLQPKDATAHYGLGHLLHMLTRDDEAKAELAQSVALQERQTASYNELGEIALELNDFDEARKEYNLVLAAAPQHGGALTGLGEVAFRMKDYVTAENYLKEAVRYAPDYATAHHYYALVLSRLGRQVEAKREADLAEEMNRKDAKERRGNVMSVLQ